MLAERRASRQNRPIIVAAYIIALGLWLLCWLLLHAFEPKAEPRGASAISGPRAGPSSGEAGR